MKKSNVFLNGEFTTIEEATLGIEDRGAIFGDGVYDFTRCYFGTIFQLDEHLQRLSNSAAAIEIPLPYSLEEMKAIIKELIAKSGIEEAGVYLQLTRGTVERSHAYPKNIKPNFFIIVREISPEPTWIKELGVATILLPDERWGRCDIKSLNLLANVMAKEKAERQDAFEAIFYKDKGIMEGSSNSVFMVFDGCIYTTPAGPWILPGITQHTIYKLAEDVGHSVVFDFIPKEKIFEADEVFITNSRYDIIPVTKIDDAVVADGKPGPITKKLIVAFQDYVQSECNK